MSNKGQGSEFWLGGAAAIAAISVMHPVDVVKSRLQIQGESGAAAGGKRYTGVISSLVRIAKSEGVRGLYRGLIPAYAMQFCVNSTRFGVFAFLRQVMDVEQDKSKSSLGTNLALAGIAGCVSAAVGNPFYAIKTRAQVYTPVRELAVGAGASSTSKPLGLTAALADIYRTEGVFGYWRGLNAFLPRVVAYGAVQLAVYGAAKDYLLNTVGMAEGLALHTGASFAAALLAVAANQPFDFVAARLTNQPVDPVTGRPLLYSGAIDCVTKSVRNEGWRCLGDGLAANYSRMFPYTVLMFVFYEQFSAIYEKHLDQMELETTR